MFVKFNGDEIEQRFSYHACLESESKTLKILRLVDAGLFSGVANEDKRDSTVGEL